MSGCACGRQRTSKSGIARPAPYQDRLDLLLIAVVILCGALLGFMELRRTGAEEDRRAIALLRLVRGGYLATPQAYPEVRRALRQGRIDSEDLEEASLSGRKIRDLRILRALEAGLAPALIHAENHRQQLEGYIAAGLLSPDRLEAAMGEACSQEARAHLAGMARIRAARRREGFV
jgi:hypothetical protein